MANKYYSLDVSSWSNWITSLENALTDKYGNNLTVHVNTSSDFIFTCPDISEKSIKITNSVIYCGTVSGTTLSPYQSFSYFYNGVVKINHLVLGDNFFLLTGVSGYTNTILIAKTIGGISVCYGGHNSNNYINYATGVGYRNGSNIGVIDFVDFGRSVYCDVAAPYKLPLTILNISSQNDWIIRQDNGTPDTIKDLYMSLYMPGTSFLKNNALFSATALYQSDGKTHLRTALLAEF